MVTLPTNFCRYPGPQANCTRLLLCQSHRCVALPAAQPPRNSVAPRKPHPLALTPAPAPLRTRPSGAPVLLVDPALRQHPPARAAALAARWPRVCARRHARCRARALFRGRGPQRLPAARVAAPAGAVLAAVPALCGAGAGWGRLLEGLRRGVRDRIVSFKLIERRNQRKLSLRRGGEGDCALLSLHAR